MQDNYCEYKPLIKYERNGLVEQIHYGLIIHMNKKGIINKVGDSKGYKFYHRSCMKPLQISPLIDLGTDKKFKLTDEEIAVCSASHTGDLIHQKYVLSVLNKINCTEDDLLCPPHTPLSEEEQKRLIINNEQIRKIHNNCSGKHSAMLAICKELGYSTENYKDFSHPLSDFIINKVCELCEVSKKDIVISKDGCGLPVIATTLEELGRGFLNVFCNEKYRRIQDAFINNPYLIGGKNRLDSDIIYASKGKLIAKVGACGLCVVVNQKKEECIVAKIADSNMEARSFAVINAILQKKWPDDNGDFSDQINKMYINKILSQDNETLGIISTCFNIC